MDKTILGAGIALVGLGGGMLTVGEIDNALHQAFATGGYLWLILGSITVGLGIKANRGKKEKNTVRKVAI